jgi:tetratricopeptide (TPR) repeat protein
MRAFVLVFVVATVARVAADVTVQPRLSPGRVSVGQAATLDVEIQGTQAAGMPAIAVPDGLQLDYRGQSTQVSIVNGAMSATLTHSFLLVPDRVGTFEVGPIRVRADGREIDAGRVRLDVVAVAASPGGTAAERGVGDDTLRLSLAFDKPRLYLHERVTLRVRLAVGSVQVTDVRYPTITADGFSTGKFDEPQQRQETRDGRPLHVVEFATDLVPLRAGETTVGGSLALAVIVRRGNPLFDQFFGMDAGFGGRKNVTLQADPVPLTILPLPDAGRPASFGGAVGAFTLEVAASPLEVRAGDPVTLTSTLRGAGNLAHAAAPAFGGGDALKVYPPTVVAETERGATIEKRFEQVVIPQTAGQVTLPALAFSFFDPATGTYRTASTAPIGIHVLPAPATTTAATVPVTAAPASRERETLGRDLVSIKDDPGALVTRGARRYRDRVFWMLQLVPLLVWTTVVTWDRRRQRLSGDERYARFTRAGAQARRALGEAKAALQAGETPRFYDALARSVHEYLAAKLGLSPGAVSADAVTDRLRVAGVASGVVDDAGTLLGLCERVRFAPTGEADMAGALARAEALVRALERQRGIGRGLALVAVALLVSSVALAGRENAKTSFFQGNGAYAAEQFAGAAAAYEAVRAAGVESASLYFNLGNTYARVGDRGRALLNYERARRLAPGDPDLHANMEFVRGDQPDDAAFPLWVTLGLPLASRFGSDALLGLAAVAWWGLMAGLIVVRLRPAARRATAWVVVGAAVFLALSGSAVAYRIVHVDQPAWAAVLRDVPVRFEPNETGTTHFDAVPGTVVEIVTERGGWAQVARRSDGRRGWVPREGIERL